MIVYRKGKLTPPRRRRVDWGAVGARVVWLLTRVVVGVVGGLVLAWFALSWWAPYSPEGWVQSGRWFSVVAGAVVFAGSLGWFMDSGHIKYRNAIRRPVLREEGERHRYQVLSERQE